LVIHFPFIIWHSWIQVEGATLIANGAQCYREAVTSQSPGLLQPWGGKQIIINPERVAPADATALRLNPLFNFVTRCET
jgi:hypothetical protein